MRAFAAASADAVSAIVIVIAVFNSKDGLIFILRTPELSIFASAKSWLN